MEIYICVLPIGNHPAQPQIHPQNFDRQSSLSIHSRDDQTVRVQGIAQSSFHTQSNEQLTGGLSVHENDPTTVATITSETVQEASRLLGTQVEENTLSRLLSIINARASGTHNQMESTSGPERSQGLVSGLPSPILQQQESLSRDAGINSQEDRGPSTPRSVNNQGLTCSTQNRQKPKDQRVRIQEHQANLTTRAQDQSDNQLMQTNLLEKSKSEAVTIVKKRLYRSTYSAMVEDFEELKRGLNESVLAQTWEGLELVYKKVRNL